MQLLHSFTVALASKLASVAERTGFEPAEAVNLARFPSVCLKPLDHLSIRFCNGNIYLRLHRIANFLQIVNDICKNFSGNLFARAVDYFKPFTVLLYH